MTQQIARLGGRRRMVSLLAAWPAALALVVALAVLGGRSPDGASDPPAPTASAAATASAGDVAPTAQPSPGAGITAVDVAPGPLALAAGRGRVWVASAADGTVRGLDPATGQIVVAARVAPGEASADPPLLAVSGAVWAAGLPDGSGIARIDATSGRVTARVAIGGVATGILGDPRGTWVTTASGAVLRLDPATGEIAATIPADGRPVYAALGATSLWLSSGSRVRRLDPVDAHLLAEIEGGGGPVAVRNGIVWARTVGSVGTVLMGVDEATGEVIERTSVATSGRADIAWALPGIEPPDPESEATRVAPRQSQILETASVTWLARPDRGQVWRIEGG